MKDPLYTFNLTSEFIKKLSIVVWSDLNTAHRARQPEKFHHEIEIADENQVMQFFIAVRDDRDEALYHSPSKLECGRLSSWD
jgi:hypothetical protein